MSGTDSMSLVPGVSPVVASVQLFVAAVDRSAGPSAFDPSRQGRFPLSAPPAGWFALGPVTLLERADTGEFAEIWSGAPAAIRTRGRSSSGATLRCTFGAWSKLAMAMTSGSQQMNLLRTAAAFTPAASGGSAESVPLLSGSTDTMLRLPLNFAVEAGDLLAVDEDYSGQTGFVGTPLAGAYLSDPGRVNHDAHYLRRITFNLARVVQVSGDSTAQNVTLASPLPSGVPTATMQASAVMGFVDRVGASYLSEWSALLIAEGVGGDRVLLHYPRLQVAAGPTEARQSLLGARSSWERWRLQGNFMAMPMTDANDGDAVLCYRSYLPPLSSRTL